MKRPRALIGNVRVVSLSSQSVDDVLAYTRHLEAVNAELAEALEDALPQLERIAAPVHGSDPLLVAIRDKAQAALKKAQP